MRRIARKLAGAGLAAAVLALCMAASLAAALDTGTFGRRAEPLAGVRPLLVIWLREADDLPAAEIGRYRRYYEETFFDAATPAVARNRLSVIAYYREVSAGKFTFARGGLIGPLTRPIADSKPHEVVRLAIDAAAGEGFGFTALDRNGDGRISADELTVLVISNASGGIADVTAAGEEIAIPGQNVSYAGRAAIVRENDDFATVNRALFHTIAPRAVDLDGAPGRCFAINVNLSLLAAVNTVNSGHTLHLDPWHKMLVGWVEPRIHSLSKAGSADLVAQHVAGNIDARRPLLLYDDTRGSAEFFLLEYRTRSRLGFDQDVGTSGLVIWQVALDSAGQPATAATDRTNCRGETLQVPALFARGAPDWQLGGGRAWSGADAPVALKWRDGADTGVRVTVKPHTPADWKLRVSWSAGGPAH